jgi:hypothetical protein
MPVLGDLRAASKLTGQKDGNEYCSPVKTALKKLFRGKIVSVDLVPL